jgi:peptidase M28-like protein
MSRIKFVTRKALWRLGGFFAFLGALLVFGYFTMVSMPGESWRGALPPLTAKEERIAGALEGHVVRLAGTIGERRVLRAATLEEAAAWIEEQLRGLGYVVESEEFQADGKRCRNLRAEIPGGARQAEVVVVGAHYDSVIGSPGANDNGTGVAALLELARLLKASAPARTVRLAAFANEEPPYFQTEEMGSLVHARAARARGDSIVAMISLETLGYYSDRPGSQSYPWPFNWCYPSTGDFIGFVGNWSSRKLVRRAIDAFRRHARFPSQGGAPPGFIPGVGWSDHWSFWQAGYPGIMVTDTAIFRYPHYHTAQDTPEKIDYRRMARVVAGLEKVVLDLAGAED